MPVLWPPVPESTPALLAVLTPSEKIAFRIAQTLLPPDAALAYGHTRWSYNQHMKHVRYKSRCLALGIEIRPVRKFRR